MESLIQVSNQYITSAVNLFINGQDTEQLDEVWREAQATTAPGFYLGSWCIVKPITAEKRFQDLLEVLEGTKRVPLEQYPKHLKSHKWYYQAHNLKNIAWLAPDDTMWLTATDAAMVSMVLYENGLGEPT